MFLTLIQKILEQKKQIRRKKNTCPSVDSVHIWYELVLTKKNPPDIVYIWYGQFCSSTPIKPSPSGWALQSGVPGTRALRSPCPLAGPIIAELRRV